MEVAVRGGWTDTAVVGRSAVGSGRSGWARVGRLSVDLNLEESDRADMESFPRRGVGGA